MNSSGPMGLNFIPRATITFALLVAFAGCVSTKYQRAPKNTPSSLALNFAAEQPAVAVTLHTVIVQKGPGSWRKEAYWDEYVCSVTNRGATLLTVESVAIIDGLDAEQSPGDEPWALEQRSRENIKKFEHSGRKIAVGAGLTLAWISTPGWVLAASAAGSGAMAWAGVATFVALPVWAVGSGVRTLVARGAVKDEFDRRRLALPFALAPGETRRGSFFLPVSPGPQRLVLHGRAGDEAQTVALDLAPLAGLHLLKQLAPAGEAKP